MTVASIRFACWVSLLAMLGGCSSAPKTVSGPTEPSLGLSTADATPKPEPLKASEAVLKTPELTVTRVAWKYIDANGVMITTPNYRLFTTVDATTFLDRLPVFYERALEHYSTSITPLPKPQRKLETFLFLTRRQWQSKTQEMLPDQAAMFSNLGRGGFTTRGTSVLYYIDRSGYPRDTFAIAAHEGWHQYTQQTFKHQLPIWLEEGLATYMEGYRQDSDELPEFNPRSNYERQQTLRESVANDELIALDQLLTHTPQSFLSESKDRLLTYYAQVWALTRYLDEGEDGRYHASLAQILSDAAEGRLVGRMATSQFFSARRRGISGSEGAGGRIGPPVVQEYFNPDLAEFERGYLAYVDMLVKQPPPPRRRR